MSDLQPLRTETSRGVRRSALLFIVAFVVLLTAAVGTATSETSRAVVAHTGGGALIGSMSPAEYRALIAPDYLSVGPLMLRATSTAGFVLFALAVTFAARLRMNGATRAATVAAWVSTIGWLASLGAEAVLVASDGYESFWTVWFCVQSLISVSASAAVALLASGFGPLLHAAWRITLGALSTLCALGAVTVGVPPAAAIVLGALLGVALLTARPARPTRRAARPGRRVPAPRPGHDRSGTR